MKFSLFLLVAFTLSHHIGNASRFLYETHDDHTPASSPLILLPPQPSQPFRPSFPAPQPFRQMPFQPAPQPFRQIPFQPAPFQPAPQPFRQIPFQPAPQPFRQIPFQPAPQPFRQTPFQPAPQPFRQIPFQPAPQPFRQIPFQPAPQPFRQFPSLPARRIQREAPEMSHCDHENKPLIDAIRNNRAYHFSWCHDGDLSYSWQGAKDYCNSRSLGNSVFQPVSINDQGENEFIKNIIATNPIPWIWTSGNRLQTSDWIWGDGSYLTYEDWSHTGGSGLPQPDNRENKDEKCLAVLKNFYQDGIKWHDIACHHQKPVICETTNI